MTIRLGHRRLILRRGLAWFLILVAALIAFELFNFSTTEYALGTCFGGHDALGLASWATVLAVAFCGIDFAGLSRLFTPESDFRREPREVWLLTGAWLLGALMNAAMTWWAVATALSENSSLGNTLVARDQILQAVPLFVAVLVWLTRVMLIGSLATSGDKLRARESRPGTLQAARPVPKPVAFEQEALAGRPAYSASLPGGPSSGAASSNSSRASTIRSYPAQESSRRHDRVTDGAHWDRPGSERGQSRSGLPFGTRIPDPEPANELQYVDVE